MSFRNFLSLFLILGTLSAVNAETEKPKYGPEATPLALSHEYFQKHPAPTFWTLIPYYLPQRDGRSCGLAAMTMVVNAIRSHQKMSAADKLATQKGLLDTVNDRELKKIYGFFGRGISLNELATSMEKTLKAYHEWPMTIETVHADPNSDAKKKLHEALVSMEAGKGTWVIANFLQGVYTGDADVGHIAPLGAYDAEKKRVLVLDPDREYYEPYWVSEETLLKGMATRDSSLSAFRGFITIKTPK